MLLAHAATDTQDLELRDRVMRFLQRELATAILVQADRGVVRLTGEVGSFYQRQRCLHACRRVAGVVRIDDELTVCAPRRRANA